MKHLRPALWLVASLATAVAAPAADGNLPRARLLFLLADGFNSGEHWGSYFPLRAAGYEVDVAGTSKGTVFVNLDRKPNAEKDVAADLGLEDVDPSRYRGLVIPGGYSPGNLEKHPRALEICRAFMEAGKPVAGICHGPRLLMKAGVLGGRTMTCLYSVADELADDWSAGAYGRYLDQAVVEDGNLITSRYPGDVEAFTAAILRRVAENGGVADWSRKAGVVLVLPGASPHVRWLFSTLAAAGVRVKVIAEKDIPSYVSSREYDPKNLDLAVLAIPAGTDISGVRGDLEKLVQGLRAAGRPVAAPAGAGAAWGVDLGESKPLVPGSPLDLAGAILSMVPPKPTPAVTTNPAAGSAGVETGAAPWQPRPCSADATYDAVVALWYGFDGQALRDVAVHFNRGGKNWTLIGPKRGALRGLNGVEVEIAGTYADAVKLAGRAVVVAPGALWPKRAEARQAQQPRWVAEQEPARSNRLDWILARYREGRTVLAVGFDTLELGAGRAEFKGKAFACSEQCVWSFGKDGATYSDRPAVQVDPHLVTCRAAAVEEGLRMVDDLTTPLPPPSAPRALVEGPVSASLVTMTWRVETADTSARGGAPGTGYYPIKGTERQFREAVDVIKLNNGIVEAWVCPAYGARLLRAIDLKTGADYFAWLRDGEPMPDKLAWNPGGVKPSFPFFEHGTHLRQPAGYRVVKNADQSVTVACDMRFTHHTARSDNWRYGRYGDESLNVMVTVKPGSSVVAWRQRKENPNPTLRADRMWNDCTLPVERATKKAMVKDKKTGKEEEKEAPDQDEMRKRTRFIYPACWAVDHGPTVVHAVPHWSCTDNWNVSYFAVEAPYGFAGQYDVPRKINRLRINDTDPAKGAAAKIYTCWGDIMEIWGGHGIVFEKAEKWSPAYAPVEFTHRFYLAQGIGEVSYANDDVAVSVDGTTFEMVATRQADAKVTDGMGAEVAAGPVGPHAVLKGTFDGKRLAVTMEGRTVMDRTFPLPRPDSTRETVLPAANLAAEARIPAEIRERFAKLVGPDPLSLEKETYGHNEGALSILDAVGAAAKVTEARDPTQVLSLARTMCRLGRLDEAVRLAKLTPGPEADFVLGLAAWEKGEPVNFQSAGWESNYMRALQAVQKGDKTAAVKWVDGYLEKVPTAWRPRLAKAYWTVDKAAARALADENPGSPEAQVVLKLLGEPHELDKLLANNPSADLHVALFEAELTKGDWKPLPRYPLPGAQGAK